MRSYLFGVVLIVMSVSCYDPHAQESRIVREVEANGSGNISTYTAPGLSEWFSTRPQLAKKIAGECEPIRQIAGANWLTSSEGSVCHAAAIAQPPPEYTADQRAW